MSEPLPITPGYLIRELEAADLPAVLEIYNDQITNPANFALWKEHPVDLADRRAWFDTLVAQERPRLAAVHVKTGRCVGYAALQTFMANYGFRRTCELTIYIHEDHRSVKLGGSLMSRLVPLGKAKGYRCIIAQISNTALGSQALVRKWGFELKGELPNVAEKFGKTDLCLQYWYLNLEP